MTRREAQRVANQLNKARWPKEVMSYAQSFPDDDGDGFVVVLSMVAGRMTFAKTIYHPFVENDFDECLEIGRQLSDRSRGIFPPKLPPTATATDPGDRSGRPAWLVTACHRVMGSNARYQVSNAAIKLLHGLEMDGIESPSVDELEGRIFLSWIAPGREINVTVDGDIVKVLVLEDGQPMPWAEDVHRWPRGRAVPSLRVWLRWMYPKKEILQSTHYCT